MKKQKSNAIYLRMPTKWLLLAAFNVMIFYNTMAQTTTYTPQNYWRFEQPNFRKDLIQNTDFYEPNAMPCTSVAGQVGNGIQFNQLGGYVGFTNISMVNNAFTIEFMLRFSNSTDGRVASSCIGLNYPVIEFITTDNTPEANGSLTNEFMISLTKTGRASYDYYLNSKWHHFVFKYDGNAGIKEVWVDGQCPEGFRTSITPGNVLTFNNYMSFAIGTQIDELAIYNKAIPPQMIAKHYDDAFKATVKQPYDYTFYPFYTLDQVAPTNAPVDGLEFAPGYPSYTVNPFEQMRLFPLPRFKVNHTMKRNVPFYDHSLGNTSSYMSLKSTHYVNDTPKYVYDNNMGANILKETAKNWNYHTSLQPINQHFPLSAYTDTASIHAKMILFANQNPAIPVSISTNCQRISGTDETHRQDLPAAAYLKRANGSYIFDMYNEKMVSPLWTTDSVQKRASELTPNILKLQSFLTRPINFVCENGEFFGEARDSTLLALDPNVLANKNASGLNWIRYQGRWQANVEGVYKNALLNGVTLPSNYKFSMYNVGATQPGVWTDYAMRRHINSAYENGFHYSTPPMYSIRPNHWALGYSAYPAYGIVAEGRATEIGLGEKFFSPFVWAGNQMDEERIVRPAQYLALLKSMSMLGADFFHTFAYASSYIDPGNRHYICDPKEYIYQIAMPIYAQATTSHFEHIFRNSTLLPTAANLTFSGSNFRQGSGNNRLVMARKANNQNIYVIYGSVQPNSNMRGNVAKDANINVMIDNNDLKFNIRRQGSTYIYDKTDPSNPIFYQLDKWHQWEHPYYWSKDFFIEAELYDNPTGTFALKTQNPNTNPNDYSTGYNTYIYFPTGANYSTPINYYFQPRDPTNNDFTIWVRARSSNQQASANIKVVVDGNLQAAKNICIDPGVFKWYHLDCTSKSPIALNNMSLSQHLIQFISQNQNLELDQFLLSTNPFPEDVIPSEIAAMSCGNSCVRLALPVSFLDFIGFPIKNKVQLQWRTTSELNNDRFEIERSPDNRTFEYIGQVKGAGIATDIKNYAFMDEKPFAKNNYYRLKQIDADGKAEYAKTVLVNMDYSNLEIVNTVLRNENELALTLASPTNAALIVQVVDISGKNILIKEIEAVQGLSTYFIPTYELSQGIYIIGVSDGINKIYRKFVK